MDFYLVFAKFSVIFLIFVQNSNGQDGNCGMAQPDPAKNWKCRALDKTEMRESGDSSFMNFGSFSMGLDDCCPTWFCDDDGSPKDCHFKRLQPGCMTPPKDKMNCVGFHDSYGCCIKWQCDEDNPKAGYCPAQLIAMRFNNFKSGNNEGQGPSGAPGDPMPPSDPSQMPPNSNSNMMMSSPPSMQIQMTTQTQNEPNNNNNNNKREKRQNIFSLFMDKMLVSCIGDSNCPDGQKCCSHDPFVYSDGQYLHKNTQPTYGYCIEPATMSTMNPMMPTMST